jgi:hypothetical protein
VQFSHRICRCNKYLKEQYSLYQMLGSILNTCFDRRALTYLRKNGRWLKFCNRVLSISCSKLDFTNILTSFKIVNNISPYILIYYYMQKKKKTNKNKNKDKNKKQNLRLWNRFFQFQRILIQQCRLTNFGPFISLLPIL